MSLLSKNSTAIETPALGWLIVVAFASLFLSAFYAEILGAIRVWWVSEIYHHGFLVVPIAAWFFRQEFRKISSAWQPSLWLPGLAMLGVSLVWILGSFMQVQLLGQMAAVALLILCVPLCLGWQATLKLWFPLTVLVYAVPVGEEMTPYLQVITADMATGLLRLFGVTSVTEGMYITTLAGHFHVAAACAGVKFLISTSMLGLITAYLYFESAIKRLGFFVLCLILPIVANGLRVFLTIMIGDWFGMEYVDGFDHLVYGWILFAMIFILIIYLGDRWGDAVIKKDAQEPTHDRTWPQQLLLIPVTLMLTVMLIIRLVSPSDTTMVRVAIDSKALSDDATAAQKLLETTRASQLSEVDVQYITLSQSQWANVEFYDGTSDNVELAPGSILGVDAKDWEVLDSAVVNGDDTFMMQSILLQDTASFTRVRARYWYQWADGNTEHRRLQAKLHQTRRALSGAGRGGYRVIMFEVSDRPNTSAESREVAISLKRALRQSLEGQLGTNAT